MCVSNIFVKPLRNAIYRKSTRVCRPPAILGHLLLRKHDLYIYTYKYVLWRLDLLSGRCHRDLPRRYY